MRDKQRNEANSRRVETISQDFLPIFLRRPVSL